MESNYIVRLNNQFYCFYYTYENEIYYRIFDKNKWTKPKLVIANTRRKYSINISYDGKIYLFCQDINGNVVLCTQEGDVWKSKMILSNQSNTAYNIFFNAIITEKGLYLIYNTPSKEDKGFYLMGQQLNEKGEWLTAERIDKISEINSDIYYVQHITKEHLILFYQTRTPETNLGYREVMSSKYGKFNIFHSTNLQIIDQSYLTTNKAIHVAYIIKGLFSTQLIYRKKENDAFAAPITIFEAARVENCLLFVVNDNLYLSFMNNGQLYYVISEDKGNTFKGPIKYKNKFCLHPTKATYISEPTQREQNFFIREVYVDSINPCDIQIIPELFDDFYPSPIIEQKPIESTSVAQKPTNETSELILKLKNQVASLEKQCEDRDKQILNLTNILKIRNEEISQLEMSRRKIQKQYDEEMNFSRGNASYTNIEDTKDMGDIEDAEDMEDIEDTTNV